MSLRVNKIFILILLLSSFAFAGEERVYVTSEKAQVKVDPRMDSHVLEELQRGAELKVLKKQGHWFQVSVNSKTGWVSRLFVSSHKPVGEADASQLAADEKLAGAARRRASSYNVSASTRGLSAEKRGREGREVYQADPAAIDEMEKAKPDENQLRKFKNQGKLSE